MWLVLLLVVPAYFVQTFIHEGAHALVAILQGHKVTSFKVWPHWVISESKERMFFWGRVTYLLKASSRGFYPAAAALRSIAPQLVTLFLFGLGAAFSLPLWLEVFWVAGAVDLTRGLLQPWWSFVRGDVPKLLYYHNGLQRWHLRTVGTALSAGIVTVTLIRVLT